MCGCADFKIKDLDAHLFIGYMGGSIDVGDKELSDKDGEDKQKEMIDYLATFESKELAELIVGFINNTDEA